MKIKVSTRIIKDLIPCKNRLDNYLSYHKTFNGDAQEFLLLENITPQDKIWVLLRLVPRTLLEVFAVNCSFNATNRTAHVAYAAYAADAAADAANAAADVAAYAASAAADAAANAAYAATYAADAAYVACVACAEREHQLEILSYLIRNWRKNE